MRFVNNKLWLFIILGVLLVLGIMSSKYMFNKNEVVEIDEVKLKESITNKKGFAIYLETANGSGVYNESNSSTFPTTGYTFNSEKSGCVDNNGNIVENALSYVNNKIRLSINKEVSCYVYFDRDAVSGMTGLQLVASEPDNLSTSLVGGLYRYQGTYTQVGNNYICFGTDSASTCTSDTDHYMYRIIGINSSGQIKVIKKEALNSTYVWNDDNTYAYNDELNNSKVTLLQNSKNNYITF